MRPDEIHDIVTVGEAQFGTPGLILNCIILGVVAHSCTLVPSAREARGRASAGSVSLGYVVTLRPARNRASPTAQE